MRVLLDTNIIVDILSKRDGYEDSLRILHYCETEKLYGCVSTTTITDIMYILRKHTSPEQLRNAVQTLLTIVNTVGVTKSDITRAFSCGMKDFEDAVQAACAKRVKAEYIVTRNLRDFQESPVQAISPSNLLKIIGRTL